MADIANIDAVRVAPLPGAVVLPGTAAATLTVGDCVYMNSAGKWAQADASAAATLNGLLGLVTAGTRLDDDGDIIADEGISVCISGPVFLGPSVAMAEESYVYPSETAGALTQTAPTINRVFASVYSTTTIVVMPDPSGATS
jgi:hypothetical protein